MLAVLTGGESLISKASIALTLVVLTSACPAQSLPLKNFPFPSIQTLGDNTEKHSFQETPRHICSRENPPERRRQHIGSVFHQAKYTCFADIADLYFVDHHLIGRGLHSHSPSDHDDGVGVDELDGDGEYYTFVYNTS